jgi:methylenetetrahydrofolate reductase (NADPH)
LKKRTRGISFEVFPPKTDEGRNAIAQFVLDLSAFDPLFVSVSYGAGGSTREGTFKTLKLLIETTRLPLMSHFTGIGETRETMDRALRTLQATGIDNILALRGDRPKNLPGFDPTAGSFPHAADLVSFIREYGTFCIGVAVYPEGHRESRGIEKDMEYTKQKIDAGADFAITQMFFDNRYYYEFRERCAKHGITVPVLPGIMPILDCVKVKHFAGMCGSTIPQEVLDRLEPLQDLPEEMRKLGVEFAIQQSEDLIRNGVPYIHFYSMNRIDTMREILAAIGPSILKKTA